MDISTYKTLRDCVHTRAEQYADDPGEKELNAPYVLIESINGGSVRPYRGKGYLKGRVTESEIDVLLRQTIEDEIKTYTMEIDADPSDPELHRRLGILNLLLKNKTAALKEYRILKDLFPSMADELMRKWNIKTPFRL